MESLAKAEDNARETGKRNKDCVEFIANTQALQFCTLVSLVVHRDRLDATQLTEPR